MCCGRCYKIKLTAMTKRNSNFINANCKRSKVDDGVSDLWNDDSNFEELEEYLVLATQVCEENGSTSTQNNASILPNYHGFKEAHKNLYTSTQTNSYIFSASTQSVIGCGNNIITDRIKPDTPIELKERIENLKEKCEYRDGEISMLRIQLKETKQNLEQEYQNKEKDWIIKLNTCNKAVTEIKSNLDFKNLEIVNLKNRLLEISKAHSVDDLLEFDCAKKNSYSDINLISEQKYKLEETCDIKHPFMYITTPPQHFPVQPKSFTIDLNLKKGSCFLDNRNNGILFKHRNTFNDDSFTFDGFSVIKPTLQKTQSTNKFIDELIIVAMSALSSLYNYLLIQEYYIQNADNLCDNIQLERLKGSEYISLLLLDASSGCDKEIEKKASNTTSVIADILPCSNYLQKKILSNKNTGNNKQTQIHGNYLNCINMIVNIINRTGKSEITQGFLGATAMLLLRLSQTEVCSNCQFCILEITKELILAKPSILVLKKLLLFLKQASIYINFVTQLCETPRLKCEVRKPCPFESLLVLYRKKMFEVESMNVISVLNTIQFVANLLNLNPLWLHYDEKHCCNCICEINTLGVTIVHELVKNYKEAQMKNTQDSKRFRQVLKHCIKVLYIITSKYFDTINKYTVDSQYKFIITYLYLFKDALGMDEFENEALHDICLQNNTHKISSTNFDKIPIWS